MTVPARTNSNSNTTNNPNAVARGNATTSALEPFKAAGARRLIEAKLPTGVTFERVMAEVYFAIQKTPKLANCTSESLVMAVAQCAAWDLEIGVKAHLVPFSVKVKDADGRDTWEDRAQAIRDYKGDAELVVRCGAARYVDAQNVYANEEFDYEQGTHPIIRHRPIFDKAKRGKLIASYAVAKVNSIDIKIIVLGVDEIDAVRQKYSKQWKGGTLEDVPWYGPKTCVHRVVKLLPSSPKLAKVLAAFEEEERLAETVGRTELPVVDVMRQLESGASSVGAAETEANIRPEAQSADTRREATATAASIDERAPLDDWRPGVDEIEPPARTRSALELFPMPFGPTVGQPMGDLPSSDLDSARRWAMKNRNHPAFVEKATQLLEDRRLGDANEPTGASA